MIQCEMPFKRSAIAVAAATAPTPTWPCATARGRCPPMPATMPMLSTWLTISKARHEPHLRVSVRMNSCIAATREAGFAPRMREQLDGRDVGVRIRDAAGHERARVRLRLADPAQARHEIATAAA